jgi:hypothetical protein
MADTSIPLTFEFKAENLPDKDTFSKSDPMLIVYRLSPKQPGFGFKPEKNNFTSQEVFRTEMVHNDLNPNWVKTMTLTYKFEEEQWMFIQVLDVDSKHSANVSDQDFLGGVVTTVGRIVNGQENGWYKTTLTDKKQQQVSVKGAASMLSVKSTVMPKSYVEYDITCTFTLASTRFFKSDTPYFQVANQNGQVVYESKKGSGKVTNYPMFTLQGMHAYKTTWKLAHNHDGDYIGSAEVNELNLVSGLGVVVLDKKGKNVGMLTFTDVKKKEVEEKIQNSIIDYINKGLNISAVIAYDFTGSNGDPKTPNSLHYLNGRNQYRDATNSIIPIIDQYDSDGKYPVYGFGMTYDNKTVKHAQLLAADAAYSDGVVMTYENTLRANGFALAGPTYFAPIIRKVSAELDDNNTYTVLVIFTDGAICDMDATIDAIVDASSKPMSIIIVGIGPADFGAMNRLDNDDKPPLRAGNRSAKRDIVQFVPLRDCPDSNTLQACTLAELPQQIMEYFRMTD